jgi:hypothetical protein
MMWAFAGRVGVVATDPHVRPTKCPEKKGQIDEVETLVDHADRN